jgi:general secretion pathway protein I
MKRIIAGFTLIEVLLALAVISIALTALLKATSQNTTVTDRIKQKSIGDWVAMQGIASLQLGLVNLTLNQESTQSIKMAGQLWFWRAMITPTDMQHVQKITVRVSAKESGNYMAPIIAYRYVP